MLIQGEILMRRETFAQSAYHTHTQLWKGLTLADDISVVAIIA